MTTKRLDFAGQSDGVTMSAANSDDFGDAAASNVTVNSQTLAYSTEQAILGTVSLKIVADTSNTVSFDVTDTAATSWSTRFYLYPTAFPSVTAAQLPCAWRTSSGAFGRLEMSTTGQVRMNMVSNSSYTTATLTLNAWNRIAVFGTGAGTSSTACTLRLYANNASSLTEEETLTGITTSGSVDRFRYGKIGSSPAASFSGYIAHIEQNVGDGNEIGPFVTTTPGWTYGKIVQIG